MLCWFLAAAAKSLQSCATLCDPIDGSPPGSSIHGILQARTLEWVAIFFSNAWKWKVKVKLLSRVQLLATPWTAAHQAPPAMGLSRQEYWSGVPLPSLLVSYEYTYVPSLSSLPPTPPPTPVSPPGHHRAPGWAPVLYGSCPLAIYFTHGNVHISMLLSQSALPSASPAVSTSPFSMSVSLFLPCK